MRNERRSDTLARFTREVPVAGAAAVGLVDDVDFELRGGDDEAVDDDGRADVGALLRRLSRTPELLAADGCVKGVDAELSRSSGESVRKNSRGINFIARDVGPEVCPCPRRSLTSIMIRLFGVDGRFGDKDEEKNVKKKKKI